MVATSATTVVQTAIPTQKVTSTVAKSGVPTSQMQQIQRPNTQIISMEALMQGARNSAAAGKGLFKTLKTIFIL